ncbi:MAG: hypothetical protein JSU06_19515 [Actinobacteria bacterium]|nr:hypothetical protein [Actinomycetota bacterium]
MEATTVRRTEIVMTEGSEVGLADFAARMDERFDRVDEKLDRADEKMVERLDRAEERSDGRFARVDERFVEVNRRLGYLDHEVGRVNDRVDDLVKVLIGGLVGFTGAILAGFAAILAMIATQL